MFGIDLSGVSAGLAAGIGAGVGIAVSRFMIRPFFRKNVKPHYERLKANLLRKRYPDYDRELSSDEVSWADDTAAKMVSEVGKTQSSGFMKASFFVFIGLILFLLLFILSILISGTIVEALLQTFRFSVPQGAMSWYRVETLDSSNFLIFFTIFAGMLFLYWSGARVFMMSQNPARLHAFLLGQYNPKPQSYWKSIIIDLIRKRHLSLNITAAMKRIGKEPFKRLSTKIGVWLIGFIGMIVTLLLLDLNYNTVIYKDRISYSPYTSFQTHNYTFQDIVGVKRSCHIVVKSKSNHLPISKLKYKLVMSDGHEVTLFGRDEGASIRSQIKALKHWHSEISEDMFTPTEITSNQQKANPPTKYTCVRNIDCDCYSTDRNELIGLFDLSPNKNH